MVVGYHAVFGAYGFWLPNDPRGSWSGAVWAPELRPFGPATKITTRQSLAHREHDRAQRFAAKQQLQYPAVRFTGLQARAVGRGFGQIVHLLSLRVYACVIMPDHVHVVLAQHPRETIESIVGFLKRAATRQLSAEGLHPLQQYGRCNGRVPTPWSTGGWRVFLYSLDDIRQRTSYVEQNPVRAHLPFQRWSFVRALDE
jgi:REP element-mobilizing transposase RayT